jgi:hypothetical protein
MRLETMLLTRPGRRSMLLVGGAGIRDPHGEVRVRSAARHALSALRFAAAVEMDPAPRSAAVFATSHPLGSPRYDLGPTRMLLRYEPRDRWPEGLGLDPSGGAAPGDTS